MCLLPSLPATSIHLSSSWLFKSPTRNRNFGVFAKFIGLCKIRFDSYLFSWPPVYLLTVYPFSMLFLSASFSIIFMFSFISVLYPPILSV